MPSWIIDLILKIALNWGIPFAVTWLFEKLPWLAKNIPNLADILKTLVENLKASESKEERKELKAEAKEAIKRECFGIGCLTDTKS